MHRPLIVLLLLTPVVLIVGAAVLNQTSADNGERVVVYCAHDSVYAEEILTAFERDTGITVAVRYDTEATKSLGLIQRLVAEYQQPQCDVFWNNELLGTQELAARNLLAPYQGSGWQRMPPQFREPSGLWAGFGARMRVYIVNRDLVADDVDPASIIATTPEHGAIAKPLYGTTLTHYSVMWRERGAAGVQAWHADLLDRGLRVVDGNGRTKDLVANGVCQVGFTDTDDAFLALDAGAPVRMEPVRLSNGKTIAIPNTVALIAGGPNRGAAERLADYLLSADVEVALANGRSRQVPLGPVDEQLLPEELRPLRAWAQDGVDLSGLTDARLQCLTWLRKVYAE